MTDILSRAFPFPCSDKPYRRPCPRRRRRQPRRHCQACDVTALMGACWFCRRRRTLTDYIPDACSPSQQARRETAAAGVTVEDEDEWEALVAVYGSAAGYAAAAMAAGVIG